MKRRTLISIVVVLSVILLLLCGTAVALMFRQTNLLANEFETAIVDCQVHEKTENANATSGPVQATTKKSIKVKNTGTIEAYIRLRFVSYWVDESKNIVGKASEMPKIPYDKTNWMQKDDIYYCKSPIAPDAFTAELLQEGEVITLKKDNVTGYRQVLEVFAEAIQSLPEKAVEGAWGVTIKEGSIQ